MPRLLVLLAIASLTTATAQTTQPNTLDVHLYGGDVAPGAPLAAWYRSIGITDVWLSPGAGAFPQDHRKENEQTPKQYEDNGVLKAYTTANIRYWWMERPVPDVLYQQAKDGSRDLWDGSPETDALWGGICAKIESIYPAIRTTGFTGLAFDNEAYYSFQGDEDGKEKPWIWKGHEDQLGLEGNYYKRGKQVGEAINRTWPHAKVIMIYAFGYEGEVWWYRGVQDGGCEVFLGAEHTYGASPGDFGDTYVHKWWGGKKTKETCDWKRTQFTFVKDNQHVMAGLFPIDFNAQKPNYRARDFREQLQSAAEGHIPVWIWPQGPFTPESWKSIHYADGETEKDYLGALAAFTK